MNETKGEKVLRGSRLNNGTGAIVLEKKAIEGAFIVLCIIPKNHEYVTWWMNQDAETCHGNYTLGLNDAIQDFTSRH